MPQQLAHSEVKRAALIVIGNEILSGRTQDTNTSVIAKTLNQKGIVLAEVRVVPDIEARIVEAVNDLRGKVDYVFTTGGIGPTHDDITAASIAKAFGVPLSIHPEAYAILEKHYGPGNFTDPRRKMAMTPEGASLIHNPVSGAPGFVMGNVHVMAGVPKIMKAMLDAAVDRLPGGKPVLSRTVDAAFPESKIAAQLGDLQKKYPTIDMGSYPQYENGVATTQLVLRGTEEGLLETAAAELTEIVNALALETPQAVKP